MANKVTATNVFESCPLSSALVVYTKLDN